MIHQHEHNKHSMILNPVYSSLFNESDWEIKVNETTGFTVDNSSFEFYNGNYPIRLYSSDNVLVNNSNFLPIIFLVELLVFS